MSDGEHKDGGAAVTLTRREVGSGLGRSDGGVQPPNEAATPTFTWEPEGRARSVARVTRAKIRRASHIRAAGIYQARQERLEALMAAVTAVQSTVALGIVAPSSDSMRLWGISVAGWVGILTFITNTLIAGMRALDMHFNNRRNVQEHMDTVSELSQFITGVYSALVPNALLAMPSRATEKDQEQGLRRIERTSTRVFPDKVRSETRASMASFHEATRHITQEGGSIKSLAGDVPTFPEPGATSPAAPSSHEPFDPDREHVFVEIEAKDV